MKAEYDFSNAVRGRFHNQVELWHHDKPPRMNAYMEEQLITCIGNKRKLLDSIGMGLTHVRNKLGKERLVAADLFSGSGVVSRYMKRYHAGVLHANDIEPYAEAVSQCFLSDPDDVGKFGVGSIAFEFNATVDSMDLPMGFFEEMYAPRDEADIQPGERVFYTRENARRLDNYCRMLDGVHPVARRLLLGPLLAKASVHVNTGGVFKSFYKENGVGKYGGPNEDALARIKGRIELEVPVLSEDPCQCFSWNLSANDAARRLFNIDVAYLDPPYNQHPYGSNYFMLNLITDYRRPADVSAKSGIPADWNRSKYNVKRHFLPTLRDLLFNLKSRYILLSFSDQGFAGLDELAGALEEVGALEDVITQGYKTYRATRGANDRENDPKEHVFVVRNDRYLNGLGLKEK